MLRCFLACRCWSLILLLAIGIQHSQAFRETRSKVKSAIFLSPIFNLGPGSVEDRFYYNIDFPEGHIAIKDFNAEVVDEDGNSVPLHETYLHHWVVVRYHQRKESENQDHVIVRNSGVCKSTGQYFGLGSETRKTETYIPDPYGIEVGNPAEIADGYEEKWLLNVHAIDTRGVEDRLGCTECKCDLYNVTVDSHGIALTPEYVGGLRCCYDRTQCRVKQGVLDSRRNLYLRYTVKWVEWDNSVIPVKIYIFDVTHGCKVEYDVESCSSNDVDEKCGCIDTKRITTAIPDSGYLIYGVAHQHTGGVGGTLYRKDGRVICSSIPTYGQGKEAGNEAGYIVGMSSCYPKPGSVKISGGESLVLESNYSSIRKHTGVMGLFYIMVAEHTPPKHPIFSGIPLQEFNLSSLALGLAFLGMAMIVVVMIRRRFKTEEEQSYQPIAA